MRSLLSSLIRPCYCNFTSFRFGRLLLRGLLVRATLHPVGSHIPTPQSCLRRRRQPRERDHSCTTAVKCHAYDRSHATRQHSGTRPLRPVWLGPQGSPGRHQAGLDVSPQCDQEFACQRYNHDPPYTSPLLADTLGKPFRKCALRLVTKPEPCRLNEGRSSSRVTRFADTLLSAESTAHMRAWRQADIGSQVSAARKPPVEHFVGKNSRCFRTDCDQMPQRLHALGLDWTRCLRWIQP